MARDAVAEVRERTDIVDLVSAYAKLTKTGRSFKGLCPFHQEKTPSFVVFPDSGNFHCFGCHKGGDAFTFYQEIEHVGFKEALTELARRAGIQLDTIPTVAPEVDEHRARLIELNDLAATFYANILANAQIGEPGRAVVAQRGLSDEMVGRFRLGYAPESWDALLRFLGSRGVDPALAAEAGLLQTRDSGGHYDRFRGRLMFPIRDREGRVVGFGGRIVGEGQPKYLNSPQSAIFDKSRLVYGLDLAKEEIRKRDQVVIVEGYMDAIAAHQFGHANVVAAMGTALTEAQVGAVKRLTSHIVLALDADAAGQMATVRSLETMRDALDGEDVPVPDASGLVRFERKLKAEIAIVQLPEGKDPDELIRRSPETWPEVVAGARPFLDFFIGAVAAGVPADDPRAKSEALKRIAPVLRGVADRVVLDHYAGLLAARLGIDQRLVLSEIRLHGLRPPTGPARPSPMPESLPAAPPPTPRRPVGAAHEDHLLAVLLRHRALCGEVLGQIEEGDLLDARNRELLRVLRDPALADMEAEDVVLGLEDALADHAEPLLATLAGKPEQYVGQVRQDALQTLTNLRRERLDRLRRQVHQEMQAAQQAGDLDSLRLLTARRIDLANQLRAFDPPPSPYFRDLRDTRVVK